MTKAAFFVHGWAMDDRIFHRKWIRELGAPLFKLFKEEFGYETFPITLPGHYLHMDKDFEWYAKYLMEKMEAIEDLEEAILVGHSMGAITIRKLLQLLQGPQKERIKRKISRVFLIGAPNHGTIQPYANTLSKIITRISNRLLPKYISHLTKANSSYLEETPCYRDLDPEGDFMRELNRDLDTLLWVDIHNIWTVADTVVEPAHSSILPGASNHLLDPISMNHFNMLYRKETVDRVRSIMNGTLRSSGPQGFPPSSGCEKGGQHQWWSEYLMPLKHELFHFRCKACKKEKLTQFLPDPLGCEASVIRDGPHHWTRVKRSYSFKYRCRNCGRSIWFPDIGEVGSNGSQKN